MVDRSNTEEKLNFRSTFLSITVIDVCHTHGRIIKWTQHIGFLTLAGMERVVEGNRGSDLKEG